MHLAADPIYVEITGEAYELRPTLRAALRLTRKHCDFVTLYNGVSFGHVTIITDVLLEATRSRTAAEEWLSDHSSVRDCARSIAGPLVAYIVRLAGLEDDEDDEDDAHGEPIPFAEYFTRLYEIGTGWLGWTPQATWDATPAEIIAAQHGRTDMIGAVLKSVFGTGQDDDATTTTPVPSKLGDDGFDPSFDRQGFAALRAKFSEAA